MKRDKSERIYRFLICYLSQVIWRFVVRPHSRLLEDVEVEGLLMAVGGEVVDPVVDVDDSAVVVVVEAVVEMVTYFFLQIVVEA